MRIETIIRLSIIGLLTLAAGCQSDGNNPWQVDKYRSPGEFTPTPQSTYAPVPRILPTVKGGGAKPSQRGDSAEELESILDELQIK